MADDDENWWIRTLDDPTRLWVPNHSSSVVSKPGWTKFWNGLILWLAFKTVWKAPCSFKEDFYKDVTGVIKSRLFSIWIEFLSFILEPVLFCIFSSNIPALIFQEAISIFWYSARLKLKMHDDDTA